MTRPMVVYGGYINGKDRIIVAATTKKEAYRAMVKAGWFGSYPLWGKYVCQTRNAREVQLACATPGVAIVGPI